MKILTLPFSEVSQVPRLHTYLTADMESKNPHGIHAVTSALSPEEQKLLQSVVQQAKQNEAVVEQTSAALSLDTNGS
jgi:hypothetical protein